MQAFLCSRFDFYWVSKLTRADFGSSLQAPCKRYDAELMFDRYISGFTAINLPFVEVTDAFLDSIEANLALQLLLLGAGNPRLGQTVKFICDGWAFPRFEGEHHV